MSLAWKLICVSLILSILGVTLAQEVAPLKCIVCDTTNEKCTTDPGSIEPTACEAEVKSCYYSVDTKGLIKRGCLDTATVVCDTTKNCGSCSTDGCNNAKDLFTCKQCDSSTDVNCSTWADETTIGNQICGTDIKRCVMKIEANKHIQRRCATAKDETCAAGEICETCDTTGCNKDVYPKDRRRCYQCDETNSKCGNPAANAIPTLPCTLYDKDDKCFVYGSSDVAMNRGCTSDTTAFGKCSAQNDKCVKCDTDNCNNSEYKKTQSVTCIQCAADDAGCAWGFADSASKSCPNQIEYWKTEGCYTQKVDTGKVARGCLNDAPTTLTCSAESTTCTTCTTSACNKIDNMEYSCYKCRSDENESCAKKLEGDAYKAETCRNPVTEADQGCYIQKWNDIVIRSCLVDADEKTRTNCKNSEYKKCSFCLEKNCNKDDPPNSSPQSIALGSGLLALTLLILRFC